jgi:hypothetical protein
VTSIRARSLAIILAGSLVGACAAPVASIAPPGMPAASASPTTRSSLAPTEAPTAEPSQAFPDDFPRQRIWFGHGYAATLDGEQRVTVGAEERFLAARERLFATVEWLGRLGSRVRVRDIRTAEVLQDVRTNGRILEGVIAGDSVYMTADQRARALVSSLGVLRLSIPNGSVTRAMTPRNRTFLGNLVASPSGGHVAVQRQRVGEDGLPVGLSAIDVHRVGGGGTWRDVVGATETFETNLMAMTDDLIIARDGRRVRAYGVPGGRQLWELRIGGTLPGYLTGDGSRLIEPLFLEDGAGERWVVAVINCATGTILTEHVAADISVPFAHLSNDRYLLFDGSDDTYRSLDLESGLIREHTIPG